MTNKGKAPILPKGPRRDKSGPLHLQPHSFTIELEQFLADPKIRTLLRLPALIHIHDCMTMQHVLAWLEEDGMPIEDLQRVAKVMEERYTQEFHQKKIEESGKLMRENYRIEDEAWEQIERLFGRGGKE